MTNLVTLRMQFKRLLVDATFVSVVLERGVLVR